MADYKTETSTEEMYKGILKNEKTKQKRNKTI